MTFLEFSFVKDGRNILLKNHLVKSK